MSRIVVGRPADPNALNEVVVSQALADRVGLAPGSILQLRLFDGADCYGSDRAWRAAVRLRVVGVGVTPGEVPPTSGFYVSSVQVTPEFLQVYGPSQRDLVLPVRLAAGADVATLMAEIAGLGAQGDVVINMADLAEGVERRTRVQAIGLALVGVLAAVAAAVVVGQVLLWQTRRDAEDNSSLAVIGITRRQMVAIHLLAALFIGAVAGLVGALVALTLSPLTPIGVARQLEQNPKFSLDAMTIGLGAALTVVFVIAVIGASAWGQSRRTTGRAATIRRPSAVAERIAHTGASPAVVWGVRMALDRGSGRAVGGPASLAAIAVAIVAVVGSLTFGAGVRHLLETPRLIGVNWDLVLPIPGGVEREEMQAVLAEDPSIAQFTAGTLWPPFPGQDGLQLGPERRRVALLSFSLDGRIGPSLTRGRLPSASDEMVVGAETLAELGLDVGDAVEAYGRTGTENKPGPENMVRMRIVGVGVMPAFGAADSRLGRGAAFTLEGVARLNPDAVPHIVWVRLVEGADVDATVWGMLDKLGLPGIPIDSFDPSLFSELLLVYDLDQIEVVPGLISGLMGMMAIGMTVHLTVNGRQSNRRDNAVLRAMGSRRRDIDVAVAVQSLVSTLTVLAVGVPVGVIIGRVAWRMFAERLGVVPEPAVAWLQLAGVILLFLAVVVVASVIVGRLAESMRPATILRAL